MTSEYFRKIPLRGASGESILFNCGVRPVGPVDTFVPFPQTLAFGDAMGPLRYRFLELLPPHLLETMQKMVG